MNHDNERKAFEDYEHSKKMDCDRDILFRRWEGYQLDDDEKHYVGKYIDSFMQEKFELWQASPSREGYKLVPVEASKETLKLMIDAYEEHLSEGMSDAYRAMIGACE